MLFYVVSILQQYSFYSQVGAKVGVVRNSAQNILNKPTTSSSSGQIISPVQRVNTITPVNNVFNKPSPVQFVSKNNVNQVV